MRVFLAIFSLFLALFWQTDAYATRYTARSIKRYVEKTPRQDENSISSLVQYLVRPLDEDYDKARAIAFWIASRINYDEYLYNNGETTKLIRGYKGQEPRELLKSRVGICGDFAALFEEMCKKAGIRVHQVHGYAYPGSRTKSTYKLKQGSYGHAWNYFLYKGRKVYVDTTFMAKGTAGVSGRISNRMHNRALKDIKQDNKYKSQINRFDDYYFDFDYDDERHERHYIHQEK